MKLQVEFGTQRLREVWTSRTSGRQLQGERDEHYEEQEAQPEIAEHIEWGVHRGCQNIASHTFVYCVHVMYSQQT